MTVSGPVAVLGCGSWGTALAIHLGRCGREVRLWGRDADLVGRMAACRGNEVYLPGIELPGCVRPTASLESALEGAVYVVAAVPSHGTRQVLRHAAPHVRPGATVVSATKGIEDGTLLRMSEVMAQEVGDGRAVAVLSGPSFAAEVARGVPTAVVVAGRRAGAVEAVQHDFRSDRFRLYASDDVVGVEIGGCHEERHRHRGRRRRVARTGAQRGGGPRDPGAGRDLAPRLCPRRPARHARGPERARGPRADVHRRSESQPPARDGAGQGTRPPTRVLDGMRMVAEGVRTTQAALALGARHGVELPITSQMTGGHRRPQDAARGGGGAHAPPAAIGARRMSIVGRLREGLRRTTERWTGPAGASDPFFRGRRQSGRGDARGPRGAADRGRRRGVDGGHASSARIGDDGAGDLRARVRTGILDVLAGAAVPVAEVPAPRVVLVVGVNGTGKTTTVGKLAHRCRLAGRDAAHLCRGHVPGGGGRADRGMGRNVRRSTSCARATAPIPPRSSSTRSRRRARGDATSCWSIPPADSIRAPT